MNKQLKSILYVVGAVIVAVSAHVKASATILTWADFFAVREFFATLAIAFSVFAAGFIERPTFGGRGGDDAQDSGEKKSLSGALATGFVLAALAGTLALFNTSCRSVLAQASPLAKLAAAAAESCKLYHESQPAVDQVRKIAADHSQVLPPKVVAALVTIEPYLETLESIGGKLCDPNRSGDLIEIPTDVPWADVLAALRTILDAARSLKLG